MYGDNRSGVTLVPFLKVELLRILGETRSGHEYSIGVLDVDYIPISTGFLPHVYGHR